mgnify:CR=1 FL=1
MRSGLTKGLTILILTVYCFTVLAYAAVSAASFNNYPVKPSRNQYSYRHSESCPL